MTPFFRTARERISCRRLTTSGETAIPIRAQKTGLVPKGWKIKTDDLEQKILLNQLKFESPVRKNEASISVKAMLKRADGQRAFGSLGLARIIINLESEGKKIIPGKVRERNLIFPRTILLGPLSHKRYGVFLFWDKTLSRWSVDFFPLDDPNFMIKPNDLLIF